MAGGPGMSLRLLLTFLLGLAAWSEADKEESWYTAFVNITYTDPQSGHLHTERSECGRYGDDSPKAAAGGALLAALGDRSACDPSATRFAVPPGCTSWMALVGKGNCTVRDKILVAAEKNASAVLVYNAPGTGNTTSALRHRDTGDTVVVMVTELKGKELLALLKRNVTVMLHVTVGTRNIQKLVSRTSVVFVSISFIVLMIISLAWLVFYYVQRLRYANARDRNQQRRLGDAAKKAIVKLPLKTIRKGDQETEVDFDNCAVCIEVYKLSDVVRILPCKHLFHKACVDPWLLDHRTCPMCKLNILKALGLPSSPDETDDGSPPTMAVSVAVNRIARDNGGFEAVGDRDAHYGSSSESDSSLDAEPPHYAEVVQVARVESSTPSTPRLEDVDLSFHDEEERLVRDTSPDSHPLAVEMRLSDTTMNWGRERERRFSLEPLGLVINAPSADRL
uniref:RING finger protein 150-like n=1 Tax=Myxine glutinosa TaxID=7769 RepID=UPI00358EB315